MQPNKNRGKKSKNHTIYKQMCLPDGSVFNGKIYGNKINGLGKITSPDGSTYEGEVKKGVPHGQGTRTWPNDESKKN